MMKFSFKKPDFSQFKIKPFWKKSSPDSESDSASNPASAKPQSTVQEEAPDIPQPAPFWKKPEPAAAKPQPIKSGGKESPEVARLKKQLSAWRWVAASCAFAALSAILLLG